MATRKRTTGRQLTAFVRRRLNQFRPNPAVPLAVSNVAGLDFVATWTKFKFSVFNRWLNRARGRS